MDIDYKSFKRFTPETAEVWGRKNYGNWLPELQNQDYEPQTPAEEFFRYYTQGVHNFFNKITRFDDIDSYDFSESFFTKEMFDNGVYEIGLHPVPNDIVVYRFIPKRIIEHMLEWGNSKSLKRDSMLLDKGFFSTTLSIEAVKNRDYANLRERSLFTIYVPKGTPCVYVDLVSDMHEQEMLFAPGIRLKVIGKRRFGKYVDCVIC